MSITIKVEGCHNCPYAEVHVTETGNCYPNRCKLDMLLTGQINVRAVHLQQAADNEEFAVGCPLVEDQCEQERNQA